MSGGSASIDIAGSGVAHDLAKRAGRGGGEAGQDRRQIGEAALAGQQPVVDRVGEQFKRHGKTAAVAPPRALGGGDRAACEARKVKRRAWKCSPSGSVTGRSPYQLISRIVASKPARRNAVARPASLPLAWMTRSASGAAASGTAKRQPSAAASGARRDRRRCGSTHVPGNRVGERGDEAADDAGADHGDAVAKTRRGIHKPLTAVSMLAARTARVSGTASGTGSTAASGTT